MQFIGRDNREDLVMSKHGTIEVHGTEKVGISKSKMQYPFLTMELIGDAEIINTINTMVSEYVDNLIHEMEIKKSIESAVNTGLLIEDGDGRFNLSLMGGAKAKHLLKTSKEARDIIRKLNIAHGLDAEHGLPPYEGGDRE